MSVDETVSTDVPDAALLELMSLHMVRGVGPRTMQSLLGHFGSAGAVLKASGAELLAVEGVGPKLSAEITKGRDISSALKEIEDCKQAGIKIHGVNSNSYPSMLKEIPDPPPILYQKGTYTEIDRMAIGIVGSRRCTYYGKKQAELLAGALARSGITIISGLARGIDEAAHRGALAAGGRTIGVLATDLENIYPPEHVDLAAEICKNGCLVSEAPLGRPVRPEQFPQRNRIISGMSLGVIIIEATKTSGSLHTARHAYEQGREVFALPGPVDRIESEGCLNLLRDGAILVRHAEDVLEALGPLIKPVQKTPTEKIITPRELQLNDQQKMILNLIDTSPRSMDEIIRDAGIETSRVLATITILEMKKLIQRIPGGDIMRVNTF
jgi:DNA processing protein